MATIPASNEEFNPTHNNHTAPLVYEDIACPSVEDLLVSEPPKTWRRHTRHFANLKSSSELILLSLNVCADQLLLLPQSGGHQPLRHGDTWWVCNITFESSIISLPLTELTLDL